MINDLSKTQRDSFFPMTIAVQTETPSEPPAKKRTIFIGSLVLASTIGLLLANIAADDKLTARKDAAQTNSPYRARSGAIVAATIAPPPRLVMESAHIKAGVNQSDKPKLMTHPRDEVDIKPKVKKPRMSLHHPAAQPTNGVPLPAALKPVAYRHNGGKRQSADQFNEFEAIVAIDKTAQGATGCLSSRDPRPPMRVAVTFANSGWVKKSRVESGPFQNTSQGECIARVLLSASIRPFEGPAVTVHRMIQIR